MTDQAPTRARPTIDVDSGLGGWPPPWPNVAELASVLPTDRWTLVGGLMTQLLTVQHGLGVVRPTNDVDIILHIETSRGIPDRAAIATSVKDCPWCRAVCTALRSAVSSRARTKRMSSRALSAAWPLSRGRGK
jgi:hypothetical protein